ncbi:MAG TPA: hypothetical protein PLO23_06720 [Alphaproteobacteria bacterium]|nr:hypothetical protein [Alphaproteobacteria bacterium]
MNSRYPALFAATAAAVLVAGCDEPKKVFACTSADEARTASVMQDWNGFKLTVSGLAGGSKVDATYSYGRRSYDNMADVANRAKDFCDTGAIPSRN